MNFAASLAPVIAEIVAGGITTVNAILGVDGASANQ
jgi:hypothetical protein